MIAKNKFKTCRTTQEVGFSMYVMHEYFSSFTKVERNYSAFNHIVETGCTGKGSDPMGEQKTKPHNKTPCAS